MTTNLSKDSDLPELPEAVDDVRCLIRGDTGYAAAMDEYFTADQMRDYARKAIAAQTAQYGLREKSWKYELTNGPVMVLYVDSINDEQVCRDDLWLATTSQLAAQATPCGWIAEQSDGHKTFFDREPAKSAAGLWTVHPVYTAAPPTQAIAVEAVRLTDKQIEAGWHDTFSTSNPYCPCNLKSFDKAVRWAERALAAPSQGAKQ